MLICFTQSLAWMYMVGGVANLAVAIVLQRYVTRSVTVAWFRTFVLLGAAYFLSFGVLVCTSNPEYYDFWMAVNAGLAAVLNMVPIVFALHLTNNAHWLSYFWMRVFVALMPALYLWISWRTNLGQSPLLSESHLEWGYHMPGFGPLINVLGLIIVVAYTVPLVIIARYYYRLGDPVKRSEMRLIMVALAIGVVPSVVGQGLVPIFFGVPSFPVGPVVSPIMNMMILYAIRKYGSRIFQVNEFSENLLQVIPGGLLVLDYTNTIQYANSGAVELLGRKPGRLAGRPMRALFATAQAYRQFESEIFGRLDQGQELAGEEIVFMARHGRQVAISLNAVNVYSGDQLVNRMLSFTDISGLKEAEAQLETEKASVERKVIERTRELGELQAQLTASMRSFPFGFAVIDRNYQVVFANDQLGTYTGQPVPVDRVASREILQIISDQYEPEITIMDCIRDVIAKRRVIERTITAGPLFFRFLFTPVVEVAGAKRAVIGVVMLMEDVTEARTLQRSRDEFFSIASHELRTPLTAIRGNTEMILRHYPEVLHNQPMREMVEDVHSASVRLIHIVNDFLDTSRLELGKIKFNSQPLEVVPALQSLLRQYEVTSSRRKLSLRVAPYDGPPVWVMADGDRFRQIIINLLGNALRATHEGGVTLAVEAGHGAWKISVTDTGKGISAQEEHLLFRKFQQVSEDILTRDNTHGTGLGLYISRKLAEGMDGKLYLNYTKVGKGSQFVLELPAAEPAAAVAPAG